MGTLILILTLDTYKILLLSADNDHIMNRRKFLFTSFAVSAMSFIPASLGNSEKLNILILGGTNFVGPAIVHALNDAGHKLTLFNRGITNPHLFPQLPKIRGDRDNGREVYQQLQKKQWDIVIDVWPSNPTFVEEAAESLQNYTKHYIYISSIAVYANYKQINMPETAPLIEGNAYEKDNYSLNKKLCEKHIQHFFPNNSSILRAGAIVGLRDDGVHFPYLVARIAEQSHIIAPDSDAPTQLIDVKDIAYFVRLCIEKRHSGCYNLVGNPIPYKSLLLSIKKALKSPVKIHWVSPHLALNKFNLSPWSDIPFWIPTESDPEPGFYQISNKLAKRKGLIFQPLHQTIRDALKSIDIQSFVYGDGAGISIEREQDIIRQIENK